MIKDPPLLTIRRNFERPSRDLLDKLAGAQTGHVVDALLGRGALDQAVKPVDAERAQIRRVGADLRDGAERQPGHRGGDRHCRAGRCDRSRASDAFIATAVVGDNLAAMAKNKGVVAIVIDGMARGTARASSASACRCSRAASRPTPACAADPAGSACRSCVRALPCRLAMSCWAIRDGVVIVPRADLADIVAKLADIRRAEEETQAKIRAGMTQMDSLTELLRSDRVVYVD